MTKEEIIPVNYPFLPIHPGIYQTPKYKDHSVHNKYHRNCTLTNHKLPEEFTTIDDLIDHNIGDNLMTRQKIEDAKKISV